MARKISPSAEHDSTRGRLLQAAGEVFAECGLRGTTIEMICRKAGANIAAVNYHFGGKENLYYETIKWGRKCCAGMEELQAEELTKLTPRQALHRFVADYLRTLLSPRNPAWYFRLISREMAEPTPALDRFIREVIHTRRLCLAGVIERIAGGKLSARRLELIGSSIVGQCLFYNHCQTIVLRLRGKSAYEQTDVDELVEHITAFSLAAIKGFTT